VSCLLLFSNCP